MRITKFTHACVRLEDDGRVLLIDPGVWTEPEALEGVDAILVTHEHADHIDEERLASLDIPIYAPAGARLTSVDFTPVAVGDELSVAGFAIRPVGGQHALIYGSLPDAVNVGYLVNDSLYHPGDSVFVPEQPIEILCVPAHAPWLKLAEAIDFAREIKAERSFAIHDAAINERGQGSVNGWFSEGIGSGFRYLTPGETL